MKAIRVRVENTYLTTDVGYLNVDVPDDADQDVIDEAVDLQLDEVEWDDDLTESGDGDLSWEVEE